MSVDTFVASHLKVKHNSAGEVSITLPTNPNLHRPPPPDNSGSRITTCLSRRGAKSIRGAVYLAGRDHGGMGTFITVTFDLEARERLASGETTIGAEISRFLDAWRSRYRKKGKKQPLFIWVAENPNDSNPHVHILTNDKVEYRHFRMWARGLEKLWGNGMVHLEKIKYAKAAGRYLMKAVGYLAKGTDGNQGSVVGQRYGVSRDLKPKEHIDYVHVGIEGVIAYRKMITESSGKKFNDIYVHEHGVWTPPGHGVNQTLIMILNLLHIPETQKIRTMFQSNSPQSFI
ncbi:hypothetical protein Ga0123461_1543 [Mariprofundus aestuarium]|uniref:Replication-associated protein ORF2/G2P domain-containing protein n=1 Tax=Mariprofundus aestuarium TaxID=1921086 RepID=A0A2K8KYB3_MARES|nr:hypothetical protein [Mariprofundus aestuarium]ATX79957.1 hypothetical protein Ga0123461_1543 [Mariprofundus aestuarium]